MNIPMYHIRLTNALNKLGEASSAIEQSYFASKNETYQKMHESIRKLHDKFMKEYLKSCKIGKKNGWIKR